MLNGSGVLWDDWGELTVSFALLDGGKTLQLRTAPEPAAGGKQRHRFELQNVPPALALLPCTNSTQVDIPGSFYVGAKLQLSVHATVQPGGTHGGCVAVQFAQPLDGQEVQALLALPYQQTRQRLHVIKQQFDDLTSTPSTSLMPLVAATNTATRLSARCQIGEPSATKTWLAEMTHFPQAVDAALASMLAWAQQCPKSRFSVRTLADCQRFSTQVKAWVCGTATLGRMKLANCQ